MIKFFRRIRQNLLSEGKTGKYLKYAFGEIVLVVIGILIALQINNWNEDRIAYAKSKNYLYEIVKDLASDTIKFNRGIQQISGMIEDEEWVLSKTSYSEEEIDRVMDCFGRFYWDLSINDRAFLKIQNSESSQLIGFEEVYEWITEYYTVKKLRVEDFGAWDRTEVLDRQNYMLDLMEDLEINNRRMQQLGLGIIERDFEMVQDSVEHARRVIEFATSIRGRNHFKNNYIRHLRIREQFVSVIESATSLIKEIRRELEIAD